MPGHDPRFDDYVEKSAAFAKPILTHIRALVHQACPDISETLKWSMPHFDHKGSVCHMASFKKHCAFGFWKQPLLEQRAFPAAKTTFDGFPSSKKKDYVEWLNEAKTEATREKRLVTTIEQLAEGKARHWKYEKC